LRYSPDNLMAQNSRTLVFFIIRPVASTDTGQFYFKQPGIFRDLR
jgi:hypothetical protein